jgi:hypothetical protein
MKTRKQTNLQLTKQSRQNRGANRAQQIAQLQLIRLTQRFRNLDAVLQSLRSNLSSDGFATSMQNKFWQNGSCLWSCSVSEVFKRQRVLRMRHGSGDSSKSKLSQSNGGRIHLDGCFLRYENTSFYGQDVDPGASAYCASTNDSDPQTFFSQRARTYPRNS